MLAREELVEQAYFFKALSERTDEGIPIQEVLAGIQEEVLATTDLPKAIEFMASELQIYGGFAPAMGRLGHYFTPFQTFVVTEAEDEEGSFDIKTGLEILRRDAEYRAAEPLPQGVFLYQFESICRNRLRYDPGLTASAEDPFFPPSWRDWILTVRRQVGLVDVADLIYVRSEYYRTRKDNGENEPTTVLFSEKEGRIALANRKKDPLLLFAALQRQLGYPEVPRPRPADKSHEVLDRITRRMERLEQRMKLVEEETKGGIKIERYFASPDPPDEQPLA